VCLQNVEVKTRPNRRRNDPVSRIVAAILHLFSGFASTILAVHARALPIPPGPSLNEYSKGGFPASRLKRFVTFCLPLAPSSCGAVKFGECLARSPSLFWENGGLTLDSLWGL